MKWSVVPGLVSVVMQVRNRLEYTRRTLASLARASGEFELVVVDNGSDDGTAEYLAGLAETFGRPVVVLRFDDDRGGAERRNVGAGAARGEFLLFLDNDVLVDDPDVVEVLVAELADPAVAAASPLLCFPGDGLLVQCAGGGSTADGRIGPVGRGSPLSDVHREHREETWGATAALLVRRSSFERIGGFDEAFDPVPLCEDIDLCLRLRAAGERIMHVGSVMMRHFEGTTFNHVGHDKLPIWKRHMRVIRSRWADVFAAGPVHTAADLAWVPVEKDYSDLDNPRVWLPTEPAPGPGFFASDHALAAARPADVRVAVVGHAPRAASFADVPGVRLVGVADPDLHTLLTAARAHDVPWALRDGVELVETVPAEGVVVRGDARAAIAALRRGAHVLLEKPGADLGRVAEAARESEGTCSVALPWGPGLADLGEAVADGRIGVPEGFAVCLEVPGRGEDTVVADLGLDALDAVERALGVPVTVVKTLEATDVRVQATAVAGDVAGTVEVGWDAPRPRLRVSVTGDGGELAVDLDEPDLAGLHDDFVAALRGGPAPADVEAVGATVRLFLEWSAEGVR
jgi:O-antigen biosynthesis protein